MNFPNLRKQQSQEVGFGKTENALQRLMNPDGSYNFVRVGLPWYESFNFYHYLISSSWFSFFLIVVLWYTIVNFIFTGLYYMVGAQHLGGMIFKTAYEQFMEVYFFSAQTLTTVGYGRINPVGVQASAVASFEALVGLLSFALFTGLLYARFSKPNAVLMFSKNAVFAPFNTGIALMFRVANKLNSNLMNMKVQITLSLIEYDAQGNSNRKFYTPLNLERDYVIFFPSSWTIVHPIDDTSPLYGMTWEDVQKTQPEILILISGFDETFDENVHSRYSYSLTDMVWGAKFIKILGANSEGRPLVDLGKIDSFDVVPIDHLLVSAPNTP
jgi:inward rectifier potassium channel